MKISYDKIADALYIKISSKKPEGTIEVKEGINIDIAKDDTLIGIEVLNASKKLSFKSFTSYNISSELLKAAG